MKKQRKTTTKKKTSTKRSLGKYKSGLELDSAKLLRESGLEFDYEGIEYVLVDGFKYDGVYHKMTPKGKQMTDKSLKSVFPIKYTPDFVAKDGSWIIETKGFNRSHHDFPMRWKLFLKFLSDKGGELPMLFICKNKSQVEDAIQIIKANGKRP
tara:strand:- start:497 stop:955 length:459 start_codon:yes stop_codon:yes gene_type:complete